MVPPRPLSQCTPRTLRTPPPHCQPPPPQPRPAHPSGHVIVMTSRGVSQLTSSMSRCLARSLISSLFCSRASSSRSSSELCVCHYVTILSSHWSLTSHWRKVVPLVYETSAYPPLPHCLETPPPQHRTVPRVL